MEEVESAIERLGEHGGVLGTPVAGRGGRVWRRLSLPRVRYYVYFKV